MPTNEALNGVAFRPLGSAPAHADDRDDDNGAVRVMTYNVDEGTDFQELIAAHTPSEFVAAVTTTYQNILATKHPSRRRVSRPTSKCCKRSQKSSKRAPTRAARLRCAAISRPKATSRPARSPISRTPSVNSRSHAPIPTAPVAWPAQIGQMRGLSHGSLDGVQGDLT